MHGKRSWRWFAAWMLPGTCLAFGVSALGIFAVPLGLVLIVALCWRRPTVEAFGLLAGLGVIVTWIWSINLNYRACTSHAASLTLAPGGPRSASYSCGGINGLPWIIVGVSGVIAAIVLYLLTSRPPMRHSKPTGAPSLSG
jgi:hypothetical protein